MRNQQFFILFFTGLFILFFHTVVEAQWGTRGNGQVEKETRKVSNFSAISVEDGLDVHIRMGSRQEVIVEADENLLDLIETEVSGNKLRAYVSKSIRNAEAMDIYITVTSLESLSSSGGSDVFSKGVLKANELQVRSSGGSDVYLDLDVDYLECQTSGGSDATLKGAVNRVVLTCSGGSDFDGKELNIGKAKVRTSGGSDAYIQVEKELDIEASGASDVYLYGSPKIVNKRVSGASDFHRKSS
ncbi:MAG: head GIN domain-containing protein [Bacteroidota bacterium]